MAVSCNKTVEAPVTGFPLEVEVQVGEATRGSYTTENLKSGFFELSVIQNTYSASKFNYESMKFSYDVASGKWQPAQMMLYEKENPAVQFFAVAPAQTISFDRLVSLQNNIYEGLAFKLFSSSVSSHQAADTNESDLITSYALDSRHRSAGSGIDRGGTNYKPVDNKISLKFHHELSRLIVRLKLGTEFNHDGVPQISPIENLTVGGSVLEYDYGWDGSSYTSGTTWHEGDYLVLKATPSSSASPGEIVPYQTDWKHDVTDKRANCVATYECIFVPQTVQFTIKFEIAGKNYKYTMPDSKSLTSPGTVYTLELSVGKDEVVANSEDFTIAPWVDCGSEDMETD